MQAKLANEKDEVKRQAIMAEARAREAAVAASRPAARKHTAPSAAPRGGREDSKSEFPSPMIKKPGGKKAVSDNPLEGLNL